MSGDDEHVSGDEHVIPFATTTAATTTTTTKTTTTISDTTLPLIATLANGLVIDENPRNHTVLDDSASVLHFLQEVDVLYGRSSSLVYDPVLERFVKQANKRNYKSDSELRGSPLSTTTLSSPTSLVSKSYYSNIQRALHVVFSPALIGTAACQRFFRQTIAPQLSVAFLPAGVTPNYFRFMQYRILQRFVNANLNVFGTQSLLLGLGIKARASQLGALSAALNWVLKDALGKMVRMIWASKMGRQFDSDAKRWRFRSSFVFAAGNGLEIVTYILPQFFLIFATLANCCKQVSMLTSSSTRTAIYNSFRDGSRENIGDITAKGEAQIAFVDLFGIASGVTLSRTVGTSVRSVVMVYVILQILELFCMYRQLRFVQYRVLNFERMVQIMSDFCISIESQLSMTGIATSSAVLSSSQETSPVVDHQYSDPDKNKHVNRTTTPLMSRRGPLFPISIPTPTEMARSERIFLPPRHLSRRAIAFGSLGRTKLSPTELQDLLHVFAKEKFLLVAGANMKHPIKRQEHRHLKKKNVIRSIQENCHIVLHSDSTNVDIVKSTLALTFLRRKLVRSVRHFNNVDAIRTADCLPLIQEALQEADQWFAVLLRELQKQGWESPARFMFGRVHMRAEWPLPKKPPQLTTSNTSSTTIISTTSSQS